MKPESDMYECEHDDVFDGRADLTGAGHRTGIPRSPSTEHELGVCKITVRCSAFDRVDYFGM